MELCPRCNRMTAETDYYTNGLICYNRDCMYNEHDNHQESLLPLEHKSLEAHRLNYPRADLERAFAEQWRKINEKDTAVNFGMGMLQDLMVRQHDNNETYFWITQREATIVATVVQWLGTNVGFGFLLTALEKVGLTITSNRVKKEMELREQKEHPKRLLLLKE